MIPIIHRAVVETESIMSSHREDSRSTHVGSNTWPGPVCPGINMAVGGFHDRKCPKTNVFFIVFFFGGVMSDVIYCVRLLINNEVNLYLT